MVLRWGFPSLAGPLYRDRFGRDAILCRRRPEPQHERVSARDSNQPTDGGPPETMAKRARGSTSRPGQRPPLQRQPARPAARPVTPTVPVERPDELTAAEEARAAELEAAIVAEERRSEASKPRARTSPPVEVGAPRATSSLTILAADEYAYVARDVRRITIVGGSLVATLFGLWAIAHVTGMGPF